MSILAICPSRGRPESAMAVLQSFRETVRDTGSKLYFVVDQDDPTKDQYPGDCTLEVLPTGCMGGALQRVSNPDVYGDATSIGMIGDDNRFRTPGWDVTIDRWLRENPGIAYPDDGFQHERLPTNWWLSRKVANRFGIAHPYLRHLYMDNYWQALGEGARCLRYFPDVLIEHLHPLAGKGVDDESYHRGGGMGTESPNIAHDRGFFEWWRQHQYRYDVEELKVLVGYRRQTGNVLADFHHPALYESLRILFEERFGWRLFRPVGIEWKDRGYWSFTNPGMGFTPMEFLAVNQGERGSDGFIRLENPQYPEHPMRGVSLYQARAMDWDHVVASVWQNQLGFNRFAEEMGAQFVHQIGNAANAVDWNLPAKYLISAKLQPESRAAVIYHQEFDLKTFSFSLPISRERPLVANFSARFNWEKGAYRVWEQAGQLAPDFDWVDHGSLYGDIVQQRDVAIAMKGTTFIWHDKPYGDGFGHVIHNAAAVGRPIVGHASYYRGRLAEPFWQDLVTAIDLDRHPLEEAIEIMREVAASPQRYEAMCLAMYDAFVQNVDFEADAANVRTLLS